MSMSNVKDWENPKFLKKKKNISAEMPKVFASMQKGSDLWLTPKSAVEIIIPFIQKFKNKVIWLPFDTKDSSFYKILKKHNFKIINSHISEGKDFFDYEPAKWDLIISNPPWSIKDKVLKRVYNLKKPFMLLLPIHSIGGKFRWSKFKDGSLQLLISKNRIEYTNPNYKGKNGRPPFESAFFCKDILEKQIQWEIEDE